ncbi:hypothetical protein [Bacillus sp. FSL K6-3431]|uniref:hypothetical protein n=1 Tax=Bacillus sp. FSL K6-3431 TaxID=2921500 RepID=UPI0030F88AB4
MVTCWSVERKAKSSDGELLQVVEFYAPGGNKEKVKQENKPCEYFQMMSTRVAKMSTPKTINVSTQNHPSQHRYFGKAKTAFLNLFPYKDYFLICS